MLFHSSPFLNVFKKSAEEEKKEEWCIHMQERMGGLFLYTLQSERERDSIYRWEFPISEEIQKVASEPRVIQRRRNGEARHVHL